MPRIPAPPPAPIRTADGPTGFAARLVAWQRLHGRHDLPWQVPDPYRVWLSEIMLQQTQVQVVIGYFHRFLERFPDVRALASAPEDAVLAAWSGLGYYQRARNLHRCAETIVAEHGGVFPASAQALAALPGIGPSTAAAIAAFCFGERAAILDGNVKRVLCRSFGVEALPTTTQGTRALLDLAETLLPDAADIAAYTQGLMDLGATVCRPRRPDCPQCPFQDDCAARRSGDAERLPLRPAKVRKRPQRQCALLWLHDARTGRIWLEKRPPTGIWPGLWSLPQFDSVEHALQAAAGTGRLLRNRTLPAVHHVFTHFELTMDPVVVDVEPLPAMHAHSGQWATAGEALALGLPAPVRSLLQGGMSESERPPSRTT